MVLQKIIAHGVHRKLVLENAVMKTTKPGKSHSVGILVCTKYSQKVLLVQMFTVSFVGRAGFWLSQEQGTSVEEEGALRKPKEESRLSMQTSKWNAFSWDI